MDNFSKIALVSQKNKLITKISSLRVSVSLLDDKNTDYAEHHQNLINAYSEMINVIDNFIENSNCIGKGR